MLVKSREMGGGGALKAAGYPAKGSGLRAALPEPPVYAPAATAGSVAVALSAVAVAAAGAGPAVWGCAWVGELYLCRRLLPVLLLLA